jgi:hypothetical protein
MRKSNGDRGYAIRVEIQMFQLWLCSGWDEERDCMAFLSKFVGKVRDMG